MSEIYIIEQVLVCDHHGPVIPAIPVPIGFVETHEAAKTKVEQMGKNPSYVGSTFQYRKINKL